MKKLAVFYHAILDGGAVPINPDFAIEIAIEQMTALKASGLESAMSEMIVGLHGSERAAVIARSLIPDKARLVQHSPGACSEIPTLNLLRAWLPGHEDWYVMYHHIKGVTHAYSEPFAAWRRRLERAVVWGWRSCVTDMDAGIDSSGGHWLTPEQWPGRVGSPFWGGTFWWATARYLRTLPPLPPSGWGNRHDAEAWIGLGPVRPRVHDYCPGWP